MSEKGLSFDIQQNIETFIETDDSVQYVKSWLNSIKRPWL